jgi:hypothetical protein
VRRDESSAPKSNSPQQSAGKGAQSQKGSGNEKGKDDKQSNNLLAELMGPKGLGSIKGNAHHGVGLFPVRF